MQTSTPAQETRWTQARARGRLLGGLVAATALATMIAVAWLFVRTQAGRHDATELDALLAAAFLLAVPPAWFVWIATGDAGAGGGPAVVTSSGLRVGRLMVSPVALPLWAWLALVASAAGQPLAAVAIALLGAVVALRGVAALVRWLVRPVPRKSVPTPEVSRPRPSERYPS